MHTVPAHKVIGDVGKPGQVLHDWPYPTQPITVDINLTQLEEQAADDRRLRLMYDNLFYNPKD